MQTPIARQITISALGTLLGALILFLLGKVFGVITSNTASTAGAVVGVVLGAGWVAVSWIKLRHEESAAKAAAKAAPQQQT